MAKILIVDDEPALLEAYARILAAANHQIFRAETGEEALATCRAERPDLVLLDSVLPGIQGLEVCKRIKGDPELSRSSVILISGRRVSPDEQAEGLESGADGYLTKPIERRTLLAHVRALLRITEAERALRESEERQRQLVGDLMRANRRLEEYNRLKAELVANMSHELRTPLTAIIGFVQLVQMTEAGKPVPPAYATAFERILRNGRHLLALIDDVLDVAKIEAGRLKINREPFDLGDVVQSAFRELRSLARQKGIDYRLSIHGPPPLAFSDPLRVRQVVVNLLSNAIKFTHQGWIEAELVAGEEGTCRFLVRDTGVGIDESAMGIIFERFRQVDGSMSRLAGGAGLGLSIVRQIVELLGGTIEVESRVGEGSTFTVTLPLVAPEPARLTSTLRSVSHPGISDGDGYVLVVDDEHGVRELLTTALRREGFRVRAVASGESALEAIAQSTPRAILCDLMMPHGMSGFELIARLRSDPRTEHTPILVVTGRDLTPQDRRLIVNQIAEVIRKGDLLITDLRTGLRETLEELGVTPTDGENPAG